MVPYGLEDSEIKLLTIDEAYELLGTEDAEIMWKMKDSNGELIFYKHTSVPFMRENKKFFRRRARQEAKERLRHKVEKFFGES